ncbi:hypothetical protein ASZ90_018861 [hydrocarbon metagenome]|uniref:Uncharacterized protein n=1 Tax=hydrocarbon metagenome TaxID=938273 RepID=A0A0W8E5M3_9ZZZZ
MLNDMKIIDIVYKYPQNEEIFKKYDEQAGCCVLCQHLLDTINELAVLYKLDRRYD